MRPLRSGMRSIGAINICSWACIATARCAPPPAVVTVPTERGSRRRRRARLEEGVSLKKFSRLAVAVCLGLVVPLALAGAASTAAVPSSASTLHKSAKQRRGHGQAPGTGKGRRWKAFKGPYFNDPHLQDRALPDREQGHRHDPAHTQGLDDPDRGLLLRPAAGREGAHRGAPSRSEGADAAQRPPGHQGHEGDPGGDRNQPAGTRASSTSARRVPRASRTSTTTCTRSSTRSPRPASPRTSWPSGRPT